MDVEAPRGLLRLFDGIQDPRVDRTKLHLLSDMLVITLCAVICGADSWTESSCSARPSVSGFERSSLCPTESLRTTPLGEFSASWIQIS